MVALTTSQNDTPSFGLSSLLELDTQLSPLDEKSSGVGNFLSFLQTSLDKTQQENNTLMQELSKLVELQEPQDTTSTILDLTKTQESFTLNPELTQTLSTTELKDLIAKAKKYLQNKITDLQKQQGVQQQELPKTLKGLMQLANDLGLDLSKIEYSDLEDSVQEKDQIKVDLKKQQVSSKNRHSDVEKKPVRVDQTVRMQERNKQVQVGKDQAIDTRAVFSKSTIQQHALSTYQLLQTQTRNTKKEQSSIKTVQKSTIAQQNVSLQDLLSRSQHNELQQDKQQKPISRDFEHQASLETLLKGNVQQNHQENDTNKEFGESSIKVHETPFGIEKATELKVKQHEAKQMMRYLSADVKNSIDNYKAPFSRVKVQLNPQRLGSVEITVVQRGDNLHINLNSNNAAINTLAMNAQELKVQLQNNGIQNASLHFSSGSSSQHNGSFSQQHQQNRHKDFQQMAEFFEEEQEMQLEIVVPYYA